MQPEQMQPHGETGGVKTASAQQQSWQHAVPFLLASTVPFLLGSTLSVLYTKTNNKCRTLRHQMTLGDMESLCLENKRLKKQGFLLSFCTSMAAATSIARNRMFSHNR